MNASYIIRKIRSGAGASLSFALMLLLITSVIGSILLTSATAAAGRASQLAKADSRYYTINSAADLVTGELEGSEIRLVRTKNETRTKVTVISENKNNYVTRSLPELTYGYPSYGVFFSGQEDNQVSRGKSMVCDWAMDKILGADFASAAAAWDRSPLSPPDALQGSVTRRYRIDHQISEGAIEGNALETAMDVEIGADGNLTVILYNVDDVRQEYYRVQLTFAADIRESTEVSEGSPVKTVTEKTNGLTGDIIRQTVETITSEITTRKTTDIRWTLIDRKELSN